MKSLLWSKSFLRAYKRTVLQHPEIRTKIKSILEQLADDPFHPNLRSHKLKGELAGSWACSIDYDYRIIFEFVKSTDSEEEILLITMGSHEEVY